MSKIDVHIIGDAFVDSFLGVRPKIESTEKADAPVYELDPELGSLLTESPGGSALLAVLITPFVGSAAVSIPATKDSELHRRLAECKTNNGQALALTLLPCTETTSKITHFYSRDETNLNRWRLVYRCDAIYTPPKSPVADFPEAKLLIVDDHGRGAITSEVLTRVAETQPSKTILSAQYENRDKYHLVLPKLNEVMLVCTERQALMWADETATPVRLPGGRPRDQLALLQFICAHLQKAFPGVRDMVITRSSPPYSCLHFYERDGEQYLRSYEGLSPLAEQTFHQVPGINTLFLVLWKQNSLRKVLSCCSLPACQEKHSPSNYQMTISVL